MVKKVISSLLALGMVFGTAAVLPEGTLNDDRGITAAAASLPKNSQEMNEYLQNAMSEQKMTFKEVKKLLDDLGYVNYYVEELGDTDPNSSKEIVTWWGSKKVGKDEYVSEAGAKSGDFYYFLNEDGTASIMGYDGVLDKLYIPETLDGYEVTSLSAPVFMWMVFNKNDVIFGGGGSGGGGFGGQNTYKDQKTYKCKIYLSEKCTVAMPTALSGEYYCLKGSKAEKYLKENGFTYKYYTRNIKKADVAVNDAAYTGKTVKPAITVKYDGKKLKKGTDYTVSYKNNKKIGTSTVTVKGKGSYTGKVSKTFKINPKKTTLKKLTSPRTKQLKVTYKKVSGVTGYQVTYSTSKKFTKATTKTATVKGVSKLSKTIKSLKKGKTYYVKVRTYKTVSGKKYYSTYTKVKKIKIK